MESALSSRNLEPWIAEATEDFGDPTRAGYKRPEETLGVLCSDQGNSWNDRTLEDLRAPLGRLEQQSIAGEIWSHSMLGCLGWPVKAVERFAGPFGGETANPMLFMSNTYDPATPIEK